MRSFTDQTGNTINFTGIPHRIVSLVPSQTELLYDLGLEEQVKGITKFCTRPQAWYKNKQRIGGTKNVNIEKVKSLQPDLIIANKEENLREQVQQLQQVAPVWVSNIETLEDALEMITSIGNLTGREEKAGKIAGDIQRSFTQLQTGNLEAGKITAAYLIWQNPYMTVGGDTFISDMLNRCSFKNVYENRERYPIVTVEQLASVNCRVLLLSSEPYPFNQKHVQHLQHHLPGTAVLLVDGQMFSWYGSRLLNTAAYFTKLKDKIISNQFILAHQKTTRP